MDVHVFTGLWIFLGKLLHDHIHRRFRLASRDAGLQAPTQVDPSIAAALLHVAERWRDGLLHHHWNPDIRNQFEQRCANETLRRDAHDLEPMTVDLYSLAA